jgi:hypothetical protein
MTKNYSDGTKRVLEQQLGSVLTQDRTKKTQTQNTYSSSYPTREYTPNCDWGGYSEVDEYYPNLSSNGYEYIDERYAESVIRKMENDPSTIQSVVDYESVDTLVDILTLLLNR